MKKQIESIEEIQSISYEILVAFDAYCKKEQLHYVLAEGTLLGAVRHNGFIPWDDDIDILMPRPDFDRFIKEVSTHDMRIGDNYKVYTSEGTNAYFCYAKIGDTRTTLIEDIYKPMKMGIHIDVFPIDGLPDDEESIRRHIREGWIIKQLIFLSCYKITIGKSIKNAIVKAIICPPSRVVLDRRKLVQKLDQTIRKYPFTTSKKAALQASGYGMKEVTEIETFTDCIQMRFVERSFNIPSNYHQYLTHLYGNYMELPPIEQRHSTHKRNAWWNYQ